MTYQLGVIPRFPARVVAGVGIRIDRANAVYTFSTDYGTVAPGSVADPVNTNVLVQLPNGTYATVPFTSFQVITRSTTAALAAVGNAINTSGKFLGKTIINTTAGTIVTANGPAAGDTWLALNGTVAHTPV